MYDRGLSCDLSNNSFDINPPQIQTNRKIALVRKGECDFYQKIYTSEQDGAVAVIIYDNVPFREDDLSGSMVK